MVYLLFAPINQPARKCFSTLICARRLTHYVLDEYEHAWAAATAERTAALGRILGALADRGVPASQAAVEAAHGQLGVGVESRDGEITVRVPFVDPSEAAQLADRLLIAYRAASLGKGDWTVSVESDVHDWSLASVDREYFVPRAALPALAVSASTAAADEAEEALGEALYGAMLAAAASSGARPPERRRLFVQVERAKKVVRTGDASAIDVHAARFVSNIAASSSRFIGVDSDCGFGLIVPVE